MYQPVIHSVLLFISNESEGHLATPPRPQTLIWSAVRAHLALRGKADGAGATEVEVKGQGLSR